MTHREKFIEPAMVELPLRPPVDQRVELPLRQFVDPRGLTRPGCTRCRDRCGTSHGPRMFGFAQAPMRTLGTSTSGARDVAASCARGGVHCACAFKGRCSCTCRCVHLACARVHLASRVDVSSAAASAAHGVYADVTPAPVVEYFAPAASYVTLLPSWSTSYQLPQCVTLLLRPWCVAPALQGTQFPYLSLSTSRLRQLGTQHQHQL